MAGKFKESFYRFMQGRYGFDQFNQALSTAFIALLIVSVICNLLSGFLGRWLAYVASLTNFTGLLLFAYMLFRVLSRNYQKRSEENRAFLKRRAKKRNKKDFKYLSCPFCKQEMRVPRGKGKIAVKCPKCGEKTIIKS